MAMLDSSTPLLQQDDMEFTNGGLELDYEDSSSGYDSFSDTESTTSSESRDLVSPRETRASCVNLAPFKPRGQEVMNFHSTAGLCSNLRLILQMPDLCDVTFLVGPEQVPVHGVRAILGTRSRVLYQLILKHQSQAASTTSTTKSSSKKKAATPTTLLSGTQKLIIPVRKYDAEVFRMIIEFVHCGSVNITEDTVAGLYCGAVQFGLADLAAACLDLVERCLENGRTEQLLAGARHYSKHTAAQTLFDKIYVVLDKQYTDKLAEMSI